jgi:2,4-dienoyl-CoA reductase-like NADH-dependent reductase (Old Yellow Enzyme family)
LICVEKATSYLYLSMERLSMIRQPLTLPNGSVLPNRIVKSAMSEALGDELNNTTDWLIKLFERWGNSGAALLITGNTPVDRWHLEHAGNFVLDEQSDMKRARKLASAAKCGGALVLLQLSHAGRQTPEAINSRPLSISDLRLDLPGYGEPKAATEEDLQTVIDKFVRSAAHAKEAGFDGVEIHAAHGYLLSSSLSPRINMRTDRWGGSLENRARLVLSVVRAVRSEVGPVFIVATKLNSSDFQKGGFSHEDSIEVAKMLQNEGIDFLEISGGNFETPVAYQYSKGSTVSREAYFLDYARDIKATLHIPVMVTGGFRSVEVMNSALADGATDIIGMGRPFIIDPEFPSKLLNGLIDMAPAIERDFPPAEKLPSGAALCWFCDQLARLGIEGDADPSVPIIEGYERYLARIRSATDRVLKARNAKHP